MHLLCHRASCRDQQETQHCLSFRSALQAAQAGNGVTSASQEAAAEPPSMRVAYQGCPGAYSEMAVRAACPDGEPAPCEQFEVRLCSSLLCGLGVSCAGGQGIGRP